MASQALQDLIAAKRANPYSADKTLAELRAQIMATPVTRCDDVAFSLFGVSMAGYNVLFSLALAFYTALAGARAIRTSRTARTSPAP